MTLVRAKARRARRKKKVRPPGNRRRPARARRSLPDRKAIAGALGRLARRSVPALIGLTFAGAAFGATLYGLHWLSSSPRFALRDIELDGNRARADFEIERRLGDPRGHNLFGLELVALEEALERDPWIEDARLRRRLPDGLRVEIEERRAAVAVDLGGLYLADEEGRVFKRASIRRGETAGLLILTGISRDEYKRDPAAAARRIRRGLEIARAYGESEDRPALGELRLDQTRGITAYTYEDAVALHFGRVSPEELDGRLQALDAAWEALSPEERRRVHLIHIGRGQAPERVTVALAENEHPWAK